MLVVFPLDMLRLGSHDQGELARDRRILQQKEFNGDDERQHFTLDSWSSVAFSKYVSMRECVFSSMAASTSTAKGRARIQQRDVLATALHLHCLCSAHCTHGCFPCMDFLLPIAVSLYALVPIRSWLVKNGPDTCAGKKDANKHILHTFAYIYTPDRWTAR